MNSLILTLLIAPPPTLLVKVDGEGYMRFVSEGRVVYATSAPLGVVNGKLAHTSGAAVLPTVRIPGNASRLEVDLEGRVVAVTPNGEANVGRLVIAVFGPGESLSPNGSFLLASSRPKLCNPGEGLAGVIRVKGPGQASVRHEPKTETVKTMRTPAKGKATIFVAPDSEAAGDRFLLGDIAQISATPELAAELQALEIGDTPVIGVSRGLDQRQILTKLKAAGYDAAAISIEIAPGAKIRRRSQIVPPEAFENAAVEAARQALGTSVALQAMVSTQEFRAPMGELELAVESCTPNSNGASVVVVVKVDGLRYNSRQIQVKPDPTAAGVRVGSPVTILVISGGAVVEVSGQARGNAYVGQTVTVKSSTGAEFTGTVLAPDRVEVKL